MDHKGMAEVYVSSNVLTRGWGKRLGGDMP